MCCNELEGYVANTLVCKTTINFTNMVVVKDSIEVTFLMCIKRKKQNRVVHKCLLLISQVQAKVQVSYSLQQLLVCKSLRYSNRAVSNIHKKHCSYEECFWNNLEETVGAAYPNLKHVLNSQVQSCY